MIIKTLKALTTRSFAIALAAALTLPALAANPKTLDKDGGFTASGYGIVGIAPDPAFRRQASDAPVGKTWLYEVAIPLQVSSTQAAIFCSIREAMLRGTDATEGNDAIVFGSVGEIATAQPVLLNRSLTEPNPNTTPAGQPAKMVRDAVRGGFVPLGARQTDGTPHPGAGTGFGFSVAYGWKVLTDTEGPPPYKNSSYSGKEGYGYWEFQQYSFDGRTFRVTATHRVDADKILPGWTFVKCALGNAITDDTDLLLAMTGTSKVAPNSGLQSGIMRLRQDGGEWRPISFNLVPGSEGTTEPSLVRDTDGSLLLSCRGNLQPIRKDIHIWRSKDNGQTWTMIIEAKGALSYFTPVTLNQAADGTLFIAGNRDPDSLSAKGDLAELGFGQRNTLCLWPLNANRSGLDAPITVRDCRAEFGPPTGGSDWTWRVNHPVYGSGTAKMISLDWTWRADHPTAMAVRLADGKWHTLLGVRVQDFREIKEAMSPTPQTGMYVHEIITKGPPHSPWNF